MDDHAGRMEDHADELAVRIGVSREVLYDRVARLGERERLVVQMRYGLGGGGARTIEEVATFLGVTSNRTSYFEEMAIDHLRHA